MAGDGTKVTANTSMAADATAGQLGLGSRSWRSCCQAEVAAWIEQARAADAAEDALSGGGDDAVPGRWDPGRGSPEADWRASSPAARRRRRSWRPGSRRRRQQAEAERAARSRSWRAEKDRLEARAAEELAKAEAKVAGYEQRAAAAGGRGAAGGRAAAPRGRRSSSATSDRHRPAAARAAPQTGRGGRRPRRARASEPPPKANTTDPASQVMPLKKGGFDELHDLQVLAGRDQVIFAIGTHPSTAGTAALHPLLAPARPTCPRPV